jgi:hypothetical protein
MAYVSGFDIDLFISYAHKDNVGGWVDNLETYLKTRVPQFLEHDAEFNLWRDPKLNGFDVIWDELKVRLQSSVLVISVLSPVYATSESCATEIDYFLNECKMPRVDPRTRLARLVIIPYGNVSGIKTAFHTNDTVTYEFFKKGGDDTILQFRAGSPEFEAQAERLAQHIASQLRRLRQAQETTREANAPPRRKIFLANCSKDRSNDRVTLLNEFRQHELLTIPDGSYSRDELIGLTNERLSEAEYAVHMFGETAGITLDDGEEPIAHLEYQLALAHRPPGFKRLVWISNGLKLSPGRHQALIEKIRAFSPEVWNEGTEVFRGGLDDFLQGVRGIVERTKPAKDIAGPLYLLCTRADLESDDENLSKLRDHLCVTGILPEFPAFDDIDVDLAELEKTLISQSCATLIYYGKGGDGWVKLKRQKVLSVVSEMHRQGRYIRALYVSEPTSVTKKAQYLDLKNQEFVEVPGQPPLLILGAASRFEPNYLTPLLEQL